MDNADDLRQVVPALGCFYFCVVGQSLAIFFQRGCCRMVLGQVALGRVGGGCLEQGLA